LREGIAVRGGVAVQRTHVFISNPGRGRRNPGRKTEVPVKTTRQRTAAPSHNLGLLSGGLKRMLEDESKTTSEFHGSDRLFMLVFKRTCEGGGRGYRKTKKFGVLHHETTTQKNKIP